MKASFHFHQGKNTEIPQIDETSTKMRKIVTIGVYGFDSEGFFRALMNANVDTFCDIRLRRGMRGKKYSFANSKQLQKRLCALNIRYYHLKNLAPPEDIRNIQQQIDRNMGVSKQHRTSLGDEFVSEYSSRILSSFNSGEFFRILGTEARVAALFCVERDAAACHRSLVAGRLAEESGIQIEHIRP